MEKSQMMESQKFGMEELEFLQKQHEIKRNVVGMGFSKAPAKQNTIRVNVLGEIIQASGFDPENIYVSYKLILPEFWALEEDKEYEDPKGELDITDLNRTESTTHNCFGVLELDKETGEYGYIYHMGFMLDWQFLVTKNDILKRGPILVMEICHINKWGHYSLEGYSFCDIPKEPGTYELDCVSWKPLQGESFQVSNYFLGGASKVRDLADVASAYYNIGGQMKASMNRMTLKTASSGKIKVRFNICHQDREVMETERNITREKHYKQKKGTNQREYADTLYGAEIMENNDDYMARYDGPE